MGQTYYDVLEIDPDATQAEVQKAYRERVLETHPDHNDASDAADQFGRISTARSVLTDGAERARYDRLGHDAYVRLAETGSGGSGSTGSSDAGATTGGDDSGGHRSRSGPETASSNRAGSTTSRGGTDGAAGGYDRRDKRTGSGRTHSRTESSHRNRTGSRRDRTENQDGRTQSHHARQRARRRRKTAQQRASGGWTFVTGSGRAPSDASSSNDTSSSSRAAATGTSAASSTPGEDAASGFRYAVHDWEEEVDLEWEDQAMTQTTAMTIGCLWLLYPIFVAASVTTLFPLAINAVVAACTLAFVGYLLTRPRIAIAVFGFWSVLFPLGIGQLASVPAFSITGLIALGFAWIPFGYAVALWWALRP